MESLMVSVGGLERRINDACRIVSAARLVVESFYEHGEEHAQWCSTIDDPDLLCTCGMEDLRRAIASADVRRRTGR